MSITPPPPPPSATVLTFDPLDIATERRPPGRPRAIRPAPHPAARAQHERARARLDAHVAGDALVQVAASETARTSVETLDGVLRELAREQAALSWERRCAVMEGRRDADRISSRRIDGLSRLAGLVLERARAGVDSEIDPNDPKLQVMVRDFFGQIRETALEVMGEETASKFVATFEDRVRGWESRVVLSRKSHDGVMGAPNLKNEANPSKIAAASGADVSPATGSTEVGS
jgi:hypothetical protein